ncbi:hypothetical protein GCM10022225_80650 [Plantactinospora mayteni]|uniref:Uncharacterized protein n=1 Tax=Plantactinospora mayteni TaxID=566021 RepID=A0ABQ4F3G3_9ACTN|nr:hypothetical protein Pma05_80250 [Plantactinospora mayteni]
MGLTDSARNRGTIHRCATAINDGLRQLGGLGVYETPTALPDFEHIEIWLHHGYSGVLPFVRSTRRVSMRLSS